MAHVHTLHCIVPYAVFFASLPRLAAKLRFEILDMDGSPIDTGSMEVFVSVISGAIGGLIIGLVTEYYTSHSYAPVREVRRSYGHGILICRRLRSLFFYACTAGVHYFGGGLG